MYTHQVNCNILHKYHPQAFSCIFIVVIFGILTGFGVWILLSSVHQTLSAPLYSIPYFLVSGGSGQLMIDSEGYLIFSWSYHIIFFVQV